MSLVLKKKMEIWQGIWRISVVCISHIQDCYYMDYYGNKLLIQACFKYSLCKVKAKPFSSLCSQAYISRKTLL